LQFLPLASGRARYQLKTFKPAILCGHCFGLSVAPPNRTAELTIQLSAEIFRVYLTGQHSKQDVFQPVGGLRVGSFIDQQTI
jgi:hypothetical protein